jgi:hypothetical protein
MNCFIVRKGEPYALALLFRFTGFYFGKFGGELLTKEPSISETPAVTCALLQALERIRTRLVIAIAVETKLTPPALRQYYLEMVDSMSECIKILRRGLRNGIKVENKCLQVLQELRSLPQPDQELQSKEALQLCRRLQHILTAISPLDD